jgi:hypothetical protein
MNAPMLASLFALLLVFSPAGDDHQDEVHLTSGKVLKGLVVYENEDVVILRVGSHDKSYTRDKVLQVISRASALERILARLDGTSPSDASGLLAIADSADEAGLQGEARLIRLQALISDPDNEAAHTALGHKRNSKGWRFKVGSKTRRFEDWPEITGKWKERYEFQTTHFDLETDLPLSQGVQAALDLERAYRSFYALLRDELGMKQIEERLAAQIHSDNASYPEPGDGRLGWFSGSDLTLFVLGQDDASVTIAHEVCHQILYYATQRARGSRGEIPAWVNEGLAQYMQFGVSRGLNGMRIETGSPELSAFRLHARHDDPFKLTRVVTMEGSDFRGGTDTPLKYAQAYTLVYFMLHASDGKYRDAFFTFLRSAWVGKSSMSHFKDVLEEELDMELDDFEALWKQYVAGTGG